MNLNVRCPRLEGHSSACLLSGVDSEGCFPWRLHPPFLSGFSSYKYFPLESRKFALHVKPQPTLSPSGRVAGRPRISLLTSLDWPVPLKEKDPQKCNYWVRWEAGHLHLTFEKFYFFFLRLEVCIKLLCLMPCTRFLKLFSSGVPRPRLG